MGFSDLEKDGLSQMIRNEEFCESLRFELPQNLHDFLQQEGLMNRIKDYAYFPSKLHRLKHSENITLHYFCDSGMQIEEVLSDVMNVLAPGYRILIDFGFVMFNDQSL